MGDDELRGIEDKAILRALELQRQVGLRIYSDGEFRPTLCMYHPPEPPSAMSPSSSSSGAKNSCSLAS